MIRLSATTVSTQYLLQGLDLTFGEGSADHHLTLYRHPSGALVFGAGTVQWSWALDGAHLDGTHFGGVSSSDARAEQAMVNLFADMGAQPASLRAGLRLATATTDSTLPTSVITSPSDGDVLMPGDAVTISGTASDADGAVGAVEVSADGGLSWHPAQGREAWTYSWTPSGNGVVPLLSRAVDDSGNLDASPGIIVSIGPPPPLPAPGGPVLVLVNGSYSANPFGKYLHELLRSEGIMLFSDADLATLAREADPAAFLDSFPVVLLAETPLLGTQEDLLRHYVARGGALVAMRPDPRLADVFGLIHLGRRNEADEQFFAIDTTTGPRSRDHAAITPDHRHSDAYMTDERRRARLAVGERDNTVFDARRDPTYFRQRAIGGVRIRPCQEYRADAPRQSPWADSEGDAARVQPGNTIVPDEYQADGHVHTA